MGPSKDLEALFEREAQRHFDFLVEQGFATAQTEGHRRSYTSSRVGVEVLYDARDGRVITVIDAFVGDRNPRASLVCLYVAAGLGPAQDVKEIVRSEKRVGPALESHAAALRAVLPHLDGPSGGSLLIECHGT